MLTRAPRLPVVLALCLTALIAAPPLLAVDLGPGIVAEDQEMRFGAETLAGAGGLAPAVSGGDLVTLAATGGGTAPGDWQILADNRLAPAADGSLDDGDSIELVANGSAVFTVTARTTPGLLTVGGADEGAEWRAAWDGAQAGERIAARDEPAIEAIPEIAIAVPRGREGGPAPYGMRFEVAGLEGPVGHILRHAEFRWDFEESYPFRRHPRDRRVATDARYARGPWAAHVFATPGRYTVRLTATFGPGRVATASRVVEITDPDRVFHGKHTIVVSQSGDFRGAPAGAQRFTRLDQALAVAQAARGGRGPKARLLLRAGETTVIEGSMRLPSVYLGRFGEGANPVVRPSRHGEKRRSLLSPGFKGQENSGATVWGIDFVGHYNAADPAMPPDPSVNVTLFRLPNKAALPHLTLFDARVSGLRGLGLYRQREGGSAIIAHSEITNWYDYGFIGGGEVAFVGNLIHQHPDAKVGPGAKSRDLDGVRNYADHGPIRVGAGDRVIVSQNYLFSNTGWSKGGIFEFAHQPAIRSGADRGSPSREYIGENHLHGGFVVLAQTALKQASGATRPSLFVVANNFVEATPGTRHLARFARSDVAARNNVFVFDMVDAAVYDRRVTGVAVGSAKDRPTRRLIDDGIFDFYNNTIILRQPPDVRLRAPLNAVGQTEAVNLANNVVIVRGSKAPAQGPDVDRRFAPRGAVPPAPGRQALIDYYGVPRQGPGAPGAVLPGG